MGAMMNKNPDDLHASVLLNEVIENLSLKQGGIYVDGTLGIGGHSKKILELIGSDGKLVGIDRDPQAIELAKIRLKDFSKQCLFFHGNFHGIKEILKELKISFVDGILLDLGVSSFQIDNAERGFSFRKDGPLDMRMNSEDGISAYDVVNSYSERELAQIIRDYGEDRMAKRIARSIVYHRNLDTIETTKQLSMAVLKAMPYAKKPKGERIHPATRTFQAIRIAVNRELEAVEKFLEDAVDCLKPGGRLTIIAFHSLEDRIVKLKFRELKKENKVNLIVKKPIFPTEEEMAHNGRARSARLRVVEKIICD
ncbi:MAG: 16S rRNA (cytosine1402-N4)-methyltransferase [Candidatus Omnitrophota bacterium]